MLYKITLRIPLERISFANFNLYYMLLSKLDHLIIFYNIILLYENLKTLESTALEENSTQRIYPPVPA